MALIVEDGTGLPNANSYVDLTYATAYFTQKGKLSDWTALAQEAQENHLMNGTEYVDKRFGSTLSGRPLKDTQALEFPRKGMNDRYGRPITGVPKNIKDAVCEYALISKSGDLYPGSLAVDENIKSKTVKVGPITTSTSYVDSKYRRSWTDHGYPDTLVDPFVNPGLSGVGKVIRN